MSTFRVSRVGEPNELRSEEELQQAMAFIEDWCKYKNIKVVRAWHSTWSHFLSVISQRAIMQDDALFKGAEVHIVVSAHMPHRTDDYVCRHLQRLHQKRKGWRKVIAIAAPLDMQPAEESEVNQLQQLYSRMGVFDRIQQSRRLRTVLDQLAASL